MTTKSHINMTVRIVEGVSAGPAVLAVPVAFVTRVPLGIGGAAGVGDALIGGISLP